MAKPNRGGLGRGLDALIPSGPAKEPEPPKIVYIEKEGSRDFFHCPIEKISPSVEQPRKSIDDARLNELTESIKAQGLIQPLIVRKEGDKFVLIAGERRWRAAQRAGLREVPVVIKETSPEAAFELALVENIQREDLNPIEEAEAYSRLVEEFKHTQESIADRVGKDRTTITNSLRLLDLPKNIRDNITRGDLSAGHGRALLSLKDKEQLDPTSKEIIEKTLSVRQTEALIKKLNSSEAEKKAAPTYRDTADIRALAHELQHRLGARVQIKDKGPKRGGLIEIPYKDYLELERILAVIRQTPREE
jgi:ParB family transcriptional regulator, chromosome partitioning protein